jgi:ribosome production factor 2
MADPDGIDLSRKAKTARGKRILKKRAPQVHENPKNAIFLRGNQSGQDVDQMLLDLFNLKKPFGLHFTRRNQKTHPFEDVKDVEYLCKKNDTSLFAFGSKSKKRPFRLILGRTFDANLLDMQEFQVQNYKPIGSPDFDTNDTPRLGSKPLLVFQGAAFDHDEDLKRCKNLLLDFFRGASPNAVVLQATDHVMAFSVLDPPPGAPEHEKKILLRHYMVRLKKSGTKLPRVVLEEIGPSADLLLDRGKPAEPTMWKASLKVPKEVKKKKVKNVSTDKLGMKRGRIHIDTQDFGKLNTHHAHNKQARGAKPAKRPKVDDE